MIKNGLKLLKIRHFDIRGCAAASLEVMGVVHLTERPLPVFQTHQRQVHPKGVHGLQIINRERYYRALLAKIYYIYINYILYNILYITSSF